MQQKTKKEKFEISCFTNFSWDVKPNVQQNQLLFWKVSSFVFQTDFSFFLIVYVQHKQCFLGVNWYKNQNNLLCILFNVWMNFDVSGNLIFNFQNVPLIPIFSSIFFGGEGSEHFLGLSMIFFTNFSPILLFISSKLAAKVCLLSEVNFFKKTWLWGEICDLVYSRNKISLPCFAQFFYNFNFVS